MQPLFIQLVLLLSCSFVNPIHAQDYLRYYALANSAHYEYGYKHNPQKALQLLDEAALIAPLAYSQLELGASCCLESGDTLRAIEFIKSSVISRNSDLERIRNFYKGLVSTPYFELIIKNFPSWQQQYYCTKNMPVIIELTRMVANDQLIRFNHNALNEKEGTLLFKTVDSSNIHRLKEIYQEYGYLDYPGMFLLYWHNFMNYPDIWSFYEPILRQAIFSGQFNPSAYAQLVDRVRIYRDNKNSWYGEFTEEGPQLKMGPIDDIGQVDARRKEIGLCTLKEKAQIVKWQLPPDYKPH